MYNDIYDITGGELRTARLAQAVSYLRGLRFSTREEYQAEVYSQLNRVTNLGNNMTPLTAVPRESPAKVGDIEANLAALNNDAQAIVAEILDAESEAASVYNLFAATQNSLRQMVREVIYGATPETYLQALLGPGELDAAASTASLDYNAAVASTPLVSETGIKPASVTVGPASSGSLAPGSSLDYLTDGFDQTVFTWNRAPATSGSAPQAAVELVFSFTGKPVLNRITLTLEDYTGIELAGLTSTPDGTAREDILAGLRDDEKFLSGASSKYAGDVILDIAPSTTSALRLLLRDSIGRGRITLRGVSFASRQYAATGSVSSTPLALSAGEYTFSSVERNDPEFGSISHQLSFDGVHFTAIAPGDTFSTPGKTWYRAQLARRDAAFSAAPPAAGTAPVEPGRLAGQDPDVKKNYTLVGSSTLVLASGLAQRAIDLAGASGSIVLKEAPLPGTLQVYFGLALAPLSAWTFANGAVVLTNPAPAVRIRYQVSGIGTPDLASRRAYYSPLLFEYSFTRI